MTHRTIIEPFRIKSVEPLVLSTPEERARHLAAAHYNPFLLASEHVIIDLLTDSGTSAMSAQQWAGVMVGDEAYAGSRSWTRMEGVIRDLTGFPHILPTHQGRAAERILYGRLGGPRRVFVSNTHFDTTRANVEATGARAVDLPIPEGRDPEAEHPFKGDLDVAALARAIDAHGTAMAAVILTVTNNSGGGQPVSLANAEAVSALCRARGVPLILDCCRIAENKLFSAIRGCGMSPTARSRAGCSPSPTGP
jgi:tryptophanase